MSTDVLEPPPDRRRKTDENLKAEEVEIPDLSKIDDDEIMRRILGG